MAASTRRHLRRIESDSFSLPRHDSLQSSTRCTRNCCVALCSCAAALNPDLTIKQLIHTAWGPREGAPLGGVQELAQSLAHPGGRAPQQLRPILRGYLASYLTLGVRSHESVRSESPPSKNVSSARIARLRLLGRRCDMLGFDA